ncbi:MAG TPA: tetratricopeptide repeat protein, partial [Thermoanaerobaculia bacterium]|nr:tetratricopeptide repeat protein [Thermoanaerobaculia bacterium]
RHYLGLHYFRTGEWERAAPLLEESLADSPSRLPALEALARIRQREGSFEEAMRLLQRALAMKHPAPPDLVMLGGIAMSLGRTAVALESFERAREMDEAGFRNDLELGVLYLAAGRLPEAREALDRVAPSHPGYAMAAFKRAQVSVLLEEPDRAARIETAKRHADATTRELIARERLFRQP